MNGTRLLAFALAFAGLLLGFWQPDRPRYRTLDEPELRQVQGQSSGKMKYASDCAQFSLGENEVVGTDCPDHAGQNCITCDLGYFGAINVTSGGNGYLVGQFACEIAKKYRGVCVEGSCINVVFVGFCSGTPEYYNDQS